MPTNAGELAFECSKTQELAGIQRTQKNFCYEICLNSKLVLSCFLAMQYANLSLERGATTHNRKVGAKKRRQASEGLNAVSRAGFLGNRGLADRFEMGTRLRFEAEGASRGFTGGTGGMSG